jgi:TonB-linked SusC/RagA family outer membrane protein
MKNFFTLLLLVVLTVSAASAQKNIRGTVSSSDGEPLIGVSILEKGTSQGTITDYDGNFELSITEGAILEFSYTGYASQSITVGSDDTYNVTLREGVNLDEVVVTALGISREKKSLTYASQEVGGEALTDVKDVNAINALTGKAAGVVINRNGSGVGGSTRIVLRGNKSLTDNEPLFVIDGIPMVNSRQGDQENLFGGGIDSGDGISNINPDDIASMTVLKGASAAALYGSQAANGVILITTKKGKAGTAKINFSSSMVTENAAYGPELQYTYGQTSDGAEFSWGPQVNASNHVDDFFQTGVNWINSLSISGGSETMQTYFSYSNTQAKGIVPTNELDRHNFTLTETGNFYDGKLEVNGSASFISQEVQNRPASGLYFNPLTGLYFFPRGLDFYTYRDNFEIFSNDRNFNVQNWVADRDIQQNPHWILNRNLNQQTRNRVIASLSAKVRLNDWLDLKLRGNTDKAFDEAKQSIYASTQATLADPNGRYILNRFNNSQTYADAILSANKQVDNLSVNANLGMSHRQTEFAQDDFDSQGADLRFANIFSLQNINQPNANFKQSLTRSKLNAAFGSVSLGLNSTYYLDATVRNDWSSALPDQSFLYYSVGGSVVLSELMGSNGIDFLKLRASYATVGNDVSAYVVNARTSNHEISSVTGLNVNRVGPIPGSTLEPELSKSLEIGLDFRTFNNKLSLDLAYYKTNTTNQFLRISAPAGSGFSQYLVNAGDVENSGVEVFLGLDLVQTDNFSWNMGLNAAANRNEIIELHPALDNGEFFINDAGVNSYAMVIRTGGSFGDIYGRKFARDANGNILLDGGAPQPTEGALEYLGNPNPDFMAGLSNTLTFKGVTLKFLIDGRFGGEVMSITEALLDEFGVSQRSADARDAGGVEVNGTKVDAEAYYTAVGGRSGITENYVYDATNIRLRELSLGFNLPKSFTENLGFLNTARISLIGRNLFFITNNAPFDPDVTFSTGVGFQGVDVFSLPSTRSFGFNLSLGF